MRLNAQVIEVSSKRERGVSEVSLDGRSDCISDAVGAKGFCVRIFVAKSLVGSMSL
jgi:hypothetical protein